MRSVYLVIGARCTKTASPASATGVGSAIDEAITTSSKRAARIQITQTVQNQAACRKLAVTTPGVSERTEPAFPLRRVARPQVERRDTA